MNSDWTKTTWGNVVELKYGKSLIGYKNSEGEYPVYGTNGHIGWCDEPLCTYPSVIIGRKGAYRGVHYSEKPFYVIDHEGTLIYMELMKPITFIKSSQQHSVTFSLQEVVG